MRLNSILIAVLLATATAAAQESLPADSINATYGELDELVITASKEVIKSDGAKLTYDLDEDTSSKGQNLLDALRKIPMVQVDGQDNIYIKGSQQFKVYVNGKEDPMLTANAKTVFKAMPAEAVSKIEVITEPGAKYDAEGTGGILNLITERKQRKDGYTGSLSLSETSSNSAESAYLRFKKGEITADINVTYADNIWQKQSSRTSMETLNFTSDEYYRELDRKNLSFKFNFTQAGLNLSWEPSERDLFTIGGNCDWMNGTLDGLHNRTEMFSRAGELKYGYSQFLDGSLTNLSALGNASYKRTFSSRGNNLVAAYAFAFGKNGLHLDYSNSDIVNMESLEAASKAVNDTYTREHTATLDYTQPLGTQHSIETGAKGIFRHNGANAVSEAGPSIENMLLTAQNLTRQLQNVYAGYMSYTGSFSKWALQAGLRYEHTYLGMDFLKGEYTDYRRHLNDFTPNAALTYMFGAATNLRLAYQRRINRPSISQMNPYEWRVTENLARKGNPHLESEHYNSLTLTYSNFGRTIGGNISLEGSMSNNTIEEFIYFDKGVQYETYGNFGHNRKMALSGFLNWTITQAMSLTVNAGINYTNIKSGDNQYRNDGWKCNYSANWNWKGPWDMRWSVYGGQSTGMVTLQGDFNGWYWYGLSLSRSFLKDEAMTVTLNGGNFLTKYQDFKSYSKTSTHSVRSVTESRNWNVGLTLQWNFGKLSEQVKKTGANLDNNDTKSSGKSGSGGIGL